MTIAAPPRGGAARVARAPGSVSTAPASPAVGGDVHGAPDGVARIGPNAILQTVAALRDRHGAAFAHALLAASTGRTPASLPDAMVDEREVQALVQAVHETCGAPGGAAILADAGRRTGDYLLAHRIPRPAQRIIRLLPRSLALRVLLGAMARNAWTFAGSGRFAYRVAAGGATLAVEACPMCRGLHAAAPACAFYAATFERLVRVLVDDRLRVRETACAAAGAADGACRFAIARG